MKEGIVEIVPPIKAEKNPDQDTVWFGTVRHLKIEFGGFQKCDRCAIKPVIYAPPDNIEIKVTEPLEYQVTVNNKAETRVLQPGIYLTGKLNEKVVWGDSDHAMPLLNVETGELVWINAGHTPSDDWMMDWRKIRSAELPRGG